MNHVGYHGTAHEATNHFARNSTTTMKPWCCLNDLLDKYIYLSIGYRMVGISPELYQGYGLSMMALYIKPTLGMFKPGRYTVVVGISTPLNPGISLLEYPVGKSDRAEGA